MTIKDLLPSPRERAMLVGCTGCGKSVLGQRLIRHYPYVVAIDPKQTLGSGRRRGKGMEGFELVTTPSRLSGAGRRHNYLQYRPDMRYENPEDWERVFSWVWKRGNTMLYNDELADVMHHYMAPPSLRRCATAGREIGIGMISATQRPRGVEQRLLSEAEHWFVFHLRKPEDRKYLSERIGPGQLEPYAFWHSIDRQPFTEPRMLRLRL